MALVTEEQKIEISKAYKVHEKVIWSKIAFNNKNRNNLRWRYFKKEDKCKEDGTSI